MTITAVFESLEEMQEFAGKLNGGSIQGAVQEFIKGEDIYRTSETRQKTCMQDKISEDRETPGTGPGEAVRAAEGREACKGTGTDSRVWCEETDGSP